MKPFEPPIIEVRTFETESVMFEEETSRDID